MGGTIVSEKSFSTPRKPFDNWRKLSFAERKKVLRDLGIKSDELIELVAREFGQKSAFLFVVRELDNQARAEHRMVEERSVLPHPLRRKKVGKRRGPRRG